MNPKDYDETIPAGTLKTLSLVEKLSIARQFYLAGGTGLAFQLRHRLSADLDFFSEKKFSRQILRHQLSAAGNFAIEKETEDTLTGVLNRIKVSFFYYPYPLLKPLQKIRGAKTAHILDIACMKIDAIASRGTKRDFIDLYFIACDNKPLASLLRLFQRKYKPLNYNLLHIKKSLIYFDDAETDPMPRMIKPLSWEAVKEFFLKETAALKTQ